MNPQRVALYARVSTKNNGQDPETQLIALREYAGDRGMTMIDDYVDVGISGAKDRRPELDGLMVDARLRRLMRAALQCPGDPRDIKRPKHRQPNQRNTDRRIPSQGIASASNFENPFALRKRFVELWNCAHFGPPTSWQALEMRCQRPVTVYPLL